METELYAEAPAGCGSNLTALKQYKVIINYGACFTVNDDSGKTIHCYWKNCLHAGYGDWKRIEVEIEKHDSKLWDIRISSSQTEKENLSKIQKQASRYEVVRKLSPRQFSKLYKRNIETGTHFDELVDQIMMGILKI